MKRAKNWKWQVCLGSLICMLAVGTSLGQATKDLTIDSVNVVIDQGQLFITPNIVLANQEHDPEKQSGHLLELAVEYGQLGYQLLSDFVQYTLEHHTCWNYQPGDCGLGECLSLYTFTSDWDGDCREWPNFYNCACGYTITPYVEPVQVEPGYQTLVLTVDPNDVVPETDESNNTVTIDLGPIANDFVTWSGVKSLYR
jgi:hypothetical protein